MIFAKILKDSQDFCRWGLPWFIRRGEILSGKKLLPILKKGRKNTVQKFGTEFFLQEFFPKKTGMATAMVYGAGVWTRVMLRATTRTRVAANPKRRAAKGAIGMVRPTHQ